MIAGYLGKWAMVQQEQLRLCEKIEQIAERLPVHDVETLHQVAGQLEGAIDRIHAFEELEMFPLLEAMSPQIRPLLGSFRMHHSTDRAMAQAIVDTLSNLAAGHHREIKLQLQHFAEALRRHVQFEEAIGMALFASKRVDDRRAVQ
jgi:hypothetical protein